MTEQLGDTMRPTALVILDGFGYRINTDYNAIAQAKTHTIANWFSQYPSALLQASGTSVGLLPAMIGNSEVGHLTLGSGRTIKQPVTLISQALEDGSYAQDPQLQKLFADLQAAGTTLHFMGLLSDAGVHSLDTHLFKLLELAQQQGIQKIKVHAFLDGRDVPPQSASIYLTRLQTVLTALGHGSIATVHGRFYAMDRDSNWDRTQKSYNTLTQPQAYHSSWRTVLQYWYAHTITDEFIPPTALEPDHTIKPGDAIIFFNFRADRARQLTRAFLDPHLSYFNTHHIPLAWFVTATVYHPDFNTHILCKKELVSDTFGDILEQAGKTLFTIAETEKYAHITYFFNGGREVARLGETRILIPSLGSTVNYTDNPEMSAPAITQTVLNSLNTQPQDIYIINYANADMVGHSGNFTATCRAIECLNTQLALLKTTLVDKLQGTLYITADHGKAEDMFDTQAQQPRTAHTNNPVPFIMLSPDIHQHYPLPLYQLADVAPFILTQLGLPVPKTMHNSILM